MAQEIQIHTTIRRCHTNIRGSDKKDSLLTCYKTKLQKVYAKYRAVKMVKMLTEPQREEMKQKISAYGTYKQ